MALREVPVKFSEYVDAQVKWATSRTAFLQQLESACGVSLLTLQRLYRGAKLKRYDKAKALCKATGGKVSLEDLCE